MVEDKLIALLQTFEYPVRRQGSYASVDDYPDSFFTFWNNYTDALSHYNNEPYRRLWSFDVNFYSTDAQKTYDLLRAAIELLRQNGFVISGCGYDMQSGTETHTGRGTEAIYLEYLGGRKQ